MKISVTERVNFNAFDSMLSSNKTKKNKASGFDIEMFNSALTRLKSALGSRDTGLMNQTVDILLDFSQNDGVKTTVKGISTHISLCEYEQAEALLDTIVDCKA